MSGRCKDIGGDRTRVVAEQFRVGCKVAAQRWVGADVDSWGAWKKTARRTDNHSAVISAVSWFSASDVSWFSASDTDSRTAASCTRQPSGLSRSHECFRLTLNMCFHPVSVWQLCVWVSNPNLVSLTAVCLSGYNDLVVDVKHIEVFRLMQLWNVWNRGRR